MTLPYLEIYVRLPLLTVQTELLTERCDSAQFHYICLRVRLWKWETFFRLYRPRRGHY
jgi:hypothetical protein